MQAYALNRFLNENIGHCEIIDYYPNNQMTRKNILRRILGTVKSRVFFRKNKAYRKFSAFQKENYIISPGTYYGDADIKKHFPKYDVLVSGSDQIFNIMLSGRSTAYYLDFDNSTKKISYASSFGRENITDDELELIKTELIKFTKLSVREISAGKIIKEQIGVDCDFVLDPVFLLEKKQWMELESKVKTPLNYILVYAMELTDYLLLALKKVQKKYDLPVVVIYGCKENHCIDGIEISDCGPTDFLAYIDNASIIVTNSFHGTALSLIYGKKCVCVAHSSRNARLQNIMMITGNRQKLIDCLISDNIEKYIVDCSEERNKLLPFIEESKNYLFSALKE